MQNSCFFFFQESRKKIKLLINFFCTINIPNKNTHFKKKIPIIERKSDGWGKMVEIGWLSINKKQTNELLQLFCNFSKFLFPQPCSCHFLIQFKYIHANKPRRNMLELLSKQNTIAWDRKGRKQ